MHNNQPPQSTSAWTTFVQQTVEKTGKLSAQDGSGTPVTLEWTIYDPTSPQFTQAIKDVSEIFTQTYTRQEVELARKRPEMVPTETYLKGVASLFEHGVDKVDWQAVEHHVRTTMHQFFTTNDFAQWASPNDLAIFVIIKDNKKGTPLGAIQFSIMPNFAYGTVRVGLTGILTHAQHRGLEKMLMSSIFKILPNVTRLFLHNRPTNATALAFYEEWGFKSFAGTNADWPDFEYLTGNSQVLQKAAETLETLNDK
jgi:GNAT superfamily N-acetyltransferase